MLLISASTMLQAADTITVYNNKAAIDWASSVTLKGTKHIKLHENFVCENHQNGTVKVTHIPGVINASDLFTKKLKNAAHFRRCIDSFMVSKSNFLKFRHCVPPHKAYLDDLPNYSIRSPFKPKISAKHYHQQQERTHLNRVLPLLQQVLLFPSWLRLSLTGRPQVDLRRGCCWGTCVSSEIWTEF